MPHAKNDIIIILHVPFIIVQDLMTMCRHLSFPIPLPKALRNHDRTIRQSIEIENLSGTDFSEI
jgi:hypothetical protein